jgi:hypothetical protein
MPAGANDQLHYGIRVLKMLLVIRGKMQILRRATFNNVCLTSTVPARVVPGTMGMRGYAVNKFIATEFSKSNSATNQK